jgi:predicted permease
MHRRYRRLFRHPPLRRDQLDRELDDEILSHIAARAEQLERFGMTPDEARAEALGRFGDPATVHHQLAQTAAHRGERIRARERAEETRTMITGLPQDVRVAARALRLNPTFAVAVVATLGLAIAAAVTAFSFVDAMFLRPLPVPNAEGLVRVYLPRHDGRLTAVGPAGTALLRERSDVFESVASERCCWVKFVRERGSLDQRYVAFVSSEFFPMLGLTPRLGRFFSPQETATPGAEPVAVISYTLWQRVFAGDPRVLGEHVAASTPGAGRDFTIIGVAPEGFDGIGIGSSRSEIWLPTTMASAAGVGCTPAIPCDDANALARLQPGTTAARAQLRLANLGAELSRVAIGDDSVRRPVLVRATGASMATQEEYSPLARLLGAIAALLLVIACANLSGLLLVRGVARSREIALRLALGAHRSRIARQLLVESGVLAMLGGALGVVLSVWTSRQLMSFFMSDSEGFETYFHVGLDARILWFALGVSLVSTLAFGLLPALIGARAQPADVLKSGGAGSGRGRSRLELITLQVALTSVLLSGAALLSRSFSHLLHAQRFDAEHVALFRVRPAAAQYDTTRSEQYVRTVAERVAALPGVECVAFARGAGFTWTSGPIEIGVGTLAGDSLERVSAHFVSPGFFQTLRIPVALGREFSNSDAAGTPLVVIVTTSLARTLSPGGDVLGKTLYAGGKAFRVVGVVPDYRIRAAHESALPMAFFAFWQNALGAERDARFAVRVHGDPARVLGVLRQTVHDIDPNVPVAELMTLSHQVDAEYPQIRLGQNVLLASGGLALLLSAIGLYGMIAFLVTRRTRDIGLRIALGAVPLRVAGQVVAGGLKATVIGVAAGVVGAWSLSHLLSTWLVGVAPHDVIAYAGAAVAVMLAAMVACAIPAARAAAIDPAVALRVE